MIIWWAQNLNFIFSWNDFHPSQRPSKIFRARMGENPCIKNWSYSRKRINCLFKGKKTTLNKIYSLVICKVLTGNMDRYIIQYHLNCILFFTFDSDIWIIIQEIRQKWRTLSLEEQEQYNYDSPNDHDSKPSSEDEANSGIHSDTSSYHAANGTYWPLL